MMPPRCLATDNGSCFIQKPRSRDRLQERKRDTIGCNFLYGCSDCTGLRFQSRAQLSLATDLQLFESGTTFSGSVNKVFRRVMTHHRLHPNEWRLCPATTSPQPGVRVKTNEAREAAVPDEHPEKDVPVGCQELPSSRLVLLFRGCAACCSWREMLRVLLSPRAASLVLQVFWWKSAVF